MSIIGLDLGYGFVKVTDGKSGFTFPSVVGEYQDNPVFKVLPYAADELNDLKIGIDGNIFNVGKAALKHSKYVYRDLSLTRSEGNDLRILFLVALGLFCTAPINKFKIVTGLPVDRYNLKGMLKELMQGEHNISLFRNGKQEDLKIIIEQVEVVIQPLGTYWSEALQSNGQTVQALERKVGIVDIGFKTSDLVLIDDGEYVGEMSKTITTAVSTSYSNIGDELFKHYGIELESHMLDECVIKRKINILGNPTDISDILNNAFIKLSKKILVELNSNWKTKELDSVLISGGGGQALYPYLAPHIKQAKLVDEAVSANSRGFYLWGRRLWNEG